MSHVNALQTVAPAVLDEDSSTLWQPWLKSKVHCNFLGFQIHNMTDESQNQTVEELCPTPE